MIGKLSAAIEAESGAAPVGNRLLEAMSSEVFSLLEPELRHTMLPQGAVCFEVGDPIEQVYFPQTGMISLLVTTGDGDIVETGSVGREGGIGLQCGLGARSSFTRAVVQIPGRFSIVSAGRFERATQHDPLLRDLVFRYIETLWAEAQQNAACNAVHDSSARLCRWLLHSADRIGGDQLLLTQEFLADMLGVRRTTVTLLAQELQKRGIVKYSRGRITILDRATLEACSCECYHAVRDDNLPLRIGVRL